jgi:hypothetical protein
MKQRRSAAVRQHAEDKQVIDHLTRDPLKLGMRRTFTEENGRKLQNAIREQGTWKKCSGLAQF